MTLSINLNRPMMFIQRRCVQQFINGIAALNTKYIQANQNVCLDIVMRSVGIVTLFDPILGHAKCDEMGKQCIAENKKISKWYWRKGC